MNHDLALELKKAGFSSNQQAWCEAYKEVLPIPTLEELIEACGERFCRFELQYWPQKHLTMQDWWATARGLNDEHYDMGGDSPTEAVARLYLALNLPPKSE